MWQLTMKAGRSFAEHVDFSLQGLLSLDPSARSVLIFGLGLQVLQMRLSDIVMKAVEKFMLLLLGLFIAVLYLNIFGAVIGSVLGMCYAIKTEETHAIGVSFYQR
jgi:hypothetical protein